MCTNFELAAKLSAKMLHWCDWVLHWLPVASRRSMNRAARWQVQRLLQQGELGKNRSHLLQLELQGGGMGARGVQLLLGDGQVVVRPPQLL